MNQTEAVSLCRLIKSLCPSQPFDRFTPDAWAIVLDDVPIDDAKAAARTIYREQGSDAEWVRKIEADDIIRRVRKVQRERIEAGEAQVQPPPYEDPASYQRWLHDIRSRLAAGESPATINAGADRAPLTERPIAQLVAAAVPKGAR